MEDERRSVNPMTRDPAQEMAVTNALSKFSKRGGFTQTKDR